MIIDWHAHVYPPEFAKEPRWKGDSPLTIEKLLDAHEQSGIDLCVVSNTVHYLKDKSREESLSFIKRWNEYGAEIQDKHSDRIVAFTSTIPGAGKEFLESGAVTEYKIHFYRKIDGWYDEVRYDSHEIKQGRKILAPHLHVKLATPFKDPKEGEQELKRIISRCL